MIKNNVTRFLDLHNIKYEAFELSAEKHSAEDTAALTGLQSGGISPLALLNKGFQICIDRSAEQHSQIHISGGQRGLNIRLAVSDLASLTNAKWVEAAGRRPE